MANTQAHIAAFQPIDDANATHGKNGKPALASTPRTQVRALNEVTYGGRPLFHWWGGTMSTNSNTILTQVWNHHHTAGTKIRGAALILHATGTVQNGQGISGTISTTTSSYFLGDVNLAGYSTQTEPANLDTARFFGDQDHAAINNARVNLAVGSLTSNGPGLTAGMLYEQPQDSVDVASSYGYVPVDQFGPDRGIVVASADTSNLARFKSQFLHTWNRKRPQIGWSIVNPGTSYVALTTSSQQYRYLFDQSIGDGGTAPSTTGPGITLPLQYAGSGRNTTVNVAIYVYAAMSGATNTGTPAISHKASGGATMTSFTAGTNQPTISGTTFAWYPGLGASPWVVPMRTDLSYERVVLGAKSGGATDHVRIAAFTMMVMPSTTIT